jgi:hypothetical protein
MAVQSFQSRRTKERRGAPRIRLFRNLYGHSVASGVQIILRDISAGAFAEESPIDFPIGAEHQFQFVAPDGRTLVVTAIAKRCAPTTLSSGERRYIAGFSLAWKSPTERKVMDSFLNALMARAG